MSHITGKTCNWISCVALPGVLVHRLGTSAILFCFSPHRQKFDAILMLPIGSTRLPVELSLSRFEYSWKLNVVRSKQLRTLIENLEKQSKCSQMELVTLLCWSNCNSYTAITCLKGKLITLTNYICKLIFPTLFQKHRSLNASLCEDANRAPPSSPLLKAAAVCVSVPLHVVSHATPNPTAVFGPGMMQSH